MIPLKITIINKPKKVKREVIKENAAGIIVYFKDSYFVKCSIYNVDGFENGIRLIPLHPSSFDCKGKTTVWVKDNKNPNKYIKIIRFQPEADNFPIANALPFRPGFIAKGSIINEHDIIYFKMSGCWHQSQIYDKRLNIIDQINMLNE